MSDMQLAFVQGQLVAAREVLDAAVCDSMMDRPISERIHALNVEVRGIIADIQERLAAAPPDPAP